MASASVQHLRSNWLACFASFCFVFLFIDASTTKIYTLSLHDALPISPDERLVCYQARLATKMIAQSGCGPARSEEHTSELQSRRDLVCRLLLEKKKRDLHVSPTRIQPTWHGTSVPVSNIASSNYSVNF